MRGALWLDAGLRTAAAAAPLLAANITPIAGLETLASPAELALLAQNTVFSLDLRDGVPLGNPSWPSDPLAIAELAVDAGFRRIIVLDIGRVGTGTGIGTESLCRHLVDSHPHVEWITGGGVRGPADLDRLSRVGISAVLVASALHDGSLQKHLGERGCIWENQP